MYVETENVDENVYKRKVKYMYEIPSSSTEKTLAKI